MTSRNRRITLLSIAFGAALLGRQSYPQTAEPALLTPEVRQAVEQVSTDRIREHVRYLSDDRLEGRDTGTPGGELAAQYIAKEFRTLRLKSAGEGESYLRAVSLLRLSQDTEKTRLVMSRPGEDPRPLQYGDDFLLNGVSLAEAQFDAPLVFVGYGISAPEFQHDDYAGIDAQGKLVVLLSGEPPSKNPALFEGEKDSKYASGEYKIRRAQEKGAAGVITILTSARAASFNWDRSRAAQSRSIISLPNPRPSRFPALLMRSQGAEKLFAGAPAPFAEIDRKSAEGAVPGFPLPVTLGVELALRREPFQSPNVAAVLDGADPELKKQVVVYSAHYDHVGVGGSSEDRIHNGAWDNASGTAGVLETARTFTALKKSARPKRSVLFLLCTGEEHGLLGSRWYVDHPAFPMAQTAANINLDMTEIFGIPKDFNALGAEHSSLMRSAEVVARELGMKVGPDPTPELRTFVRSDQFSFVQAGVPSLFLRWGNEYEDIPADQVKQRHKQKLDSIYHNVKDEFDPTWSWEGMRRHTQIAFLLGLHVANQPEMPSWNAESSFNKPRKM